MPKIIDYSGRFAFFELACFTLVRDHGVDRLSRHGVARVLASSISTVRRLLNSEADLRNLALSEVAVRRRSRLGGRPRRTGLESGGVESGGVESGAVEAGVDLVRGLIPDHARHIAEELVWWRLAIAAPSTAVMPEDHEDDEGPLHHRFSIANHGYVTPDVLHADIERPRAPIGADGDADPVVAAVQDRHEDVASRVAYVVDVVVPALDDEVAAVQSAILHALVDGLGVTVCLGHLQPDEAVEILRGHLTTLALLGPR